MNLHRAISCILLLLAYCNKTSDGASETTTAKLDTTTFKPPSTSQYTTTWTNTPVTEDAFQILQDQIDALGAQVDDLAEEVSENEAVANQTITALEAEVEQLEQRVTQLEGQYDDLISAMEAQSAKRTCQDYYDVGLGSGYYYIDPDGDGDDYVSFQVYCDMDSMPGYGITSFGHDSENRTRVDGCEEPGCYTRDVVYDNTLSDIRGVVTLSQYCRQYVKYECLSSMMFTYDLNTWWRSYDDVPQYYWGGADPGSEMCACGKQENCDLDSTTCNCDNNDQIWREDDGYLDDIKTLPVTQLAFGDTEAFDERGFHTLGPLECYGHANGNTCKDLKESGYPSGTYSISPNPGSGNEFEVYCDMEAYPGSGVTVIRHDQEQSSRIYGSLSGKDVDVIYNTTMDNILSLIEASTQCTQYVSWKCYRTGFFNQGTYWKSRNGTAMTYWGGAAPNHEGYCACGEAGSCTGSYSYKCNCDYTDYTYTYIDAGQLIDKTVLPVTGFHFGFYSSSSSYYGDLEVGPLHCF